MGSDGGVAAMALPATEVIVGTPSGTAVFDLQAELDPATSVPLRTKNAEVSRTVAIQSDLMAAGLVTSSMEAQWGTNAVSMKKWIWSRLRAWLGSSSSCTDLNKSRCGARGDQRGGTGTLPRVPVLSPTLHRRLAYCGRDFQPGKNRGLGLGLALTDHMPYRFTASATPSESARDVAVFRATFARYRGRLTTR